MGGARGVVSWHTAVRIAGLSEKKTPGRKKSTHHCNTNIRILPLALSRWKCSAAAKLRGSSKLSKSYTQTHIQTTQNSLSADKLQKYYQELLQDS